MLLAQQTVLVNLGKDHDIILIIGDSIARGNSTAFGPTPTAGTVKQWDDASGIVINVGSTDLIEANPAGGSQWPDMGIGYNAVTKSIPVFINNGIGGSLFNAPVNPELSWYTDGDLWDASVLKARRGLNFMGRANPDVVYIHLGISDANQVPFIMTYAHATSLIDRINTEYNSPRILISQPGGPFLTTYAQLTSEWTVRKYIKKLMVDYANVEICGHLGNFITWTGCFNADNIHLNAAGNAFLGNRIARQLITPPLFHKYTKSIIGQMFSNITSTRQVWINDFVLALDAAGILYELDSLHIWGALTSGISDWKNAVADWAMLSNGGSLNATDITPTGLALNGTTSRGAVGQYSIFMDKALPLSDAIVGYFLIDNQTAAGTAAYLGGVRESAAGAIVAIRQNIASNIGIFGFTATESTDATETAFADNSHYAVVRNGGNHMLIKNTTTVINAAVASTALSPGANIRSASVGVLNNNGALQAYITGKMGAEYCAKYSTFNVTAFYNAMNTLLANWLTDTP